MPVFGVKGRIGRERGTLERLPSGMKGGRIRYSYCTVLHCRSVCQREKGKFEHYQGKLELREMCSSKALMVPDSKTTLGERKS